MKKYLYFLVFSVILFACSKEESEAVDFRENNPEYSKLTVDGGFIFMRAPSGGKLSLGASAHYFQKATNKYIYFSMYGSEGSICIGSGSGSVNFTLDGKTYNVKSKQELGFELVDNEYVLYRTLNCDQ